MAEARIESFFQIKDPYMELHETEKFLSQEKKLKKEARFQDTILRQTGNDPYYHKNKFNKSQTYHNIDYILHPSDEPFVRPEITSDYIEKNPQGTKNFYPSFQPGKYVDIKEHEREFDELLLRKSNPIPSEEEILRNLVKRCIKEEEAIASLQNDIQIRIDSLQKSNLEHAGSFKNYFRNLCHWMILGKLEENMNKNVLANEEGVLLSKKEYHYEEIAGLPEMHDAIINLHNETKESLDFVINKVENDMVREQNEKVKEGRKNLEEQLRREKLMEELRKKMLEDEQKLLKARGEKLKEAKQNAGIYQSIIERVYKSYNDVFLKYLKDNKITVNTEIVSWNDNVAIQMPIEKDIEKDFINALDTKFADINKLKKQLFEINIYLNNQILEIKQNIKDALWAADELKSVFEFRPEEDGKNLESIEKFNKGFDEMLEILVTKRKKLTTYNLAIQWYLKNKSSILRDLVYDTPIDLWANGDVLYSNKINDTPQILLSYRVYDEDGNSLKTVTVSPVQDITKLEIYSYNVKDSKGKEKPVEFSIRPVKRRGNTRVEIKVTVKDIVTA